MQMQERILEKLFDSLRINNTDFRKTSLGISEICCDWMGGVHDFYRCQAEKLNNGMKPCLEHIRDWVVNNRRDKFMNFFNKGSNAKA